MTSQEMETIESRYAVVPSRGCYGSGDTVRALRVCRDLRTAVRLATAGTREYRRGMPGYTSGGYRVVETDARTRADAVWLGHDLDRDPGVK